MGRRDEAVKRAESVMKAFHAFLTLADVDRDKPATGRNVALAVGIVEHPDGRWVLSVEDMAKPGAGMFCFPAVQSEAEARKGMALLNNMLRGLSASHPPRFDD